MSQPVILVTGANGQVGQELRALAPVYNTSSVLSGNIATRTLPVTWLYFNATQKSDMAAIDKIESPNL